MRAPGHTVCGTRTSPGAYVTQLQVALAVTDVTLACGKFLTRNLLPRPVFDSRPVRKILHRIPQESRSPLQQRLVYWADSYDAIICYKNITPLQQ